jgi:hypothetical protein
MSGERKLFRVFEGQTTATPEALSRLHARLAGTREHDPEIARALGHAPGADGRALARVRARIAAGRIAVAQPWSSVRWGFPLALAAALLLTLASLPRWKGEGDPGRPIADALVSETAWTASAPTPEVSLRFQGSGAVSGDAQHPMVRWHVGSLDVDVVPDRGVELAVVTREARVSVIGTGFTVTRDALGTHVRVRHGRVSVACGTREPAFLDPGDEIACLPTTAIGFLARANQLGDQGAPPADILAAAEGGLSLSNSGADDATIRDELVRLRAEALYDVGRAAEALEVAAAALPSATHRATDLRHLAARAGMASAGCDAALPYLSELRARDATGPELVQYADCVVGTDPVGARDALLAALSKADGEAATRVIEGRLARLPGE